MAQQMLEEFHATHPNIHVFYTPDPPDLTEKMMTDFQAESAPDVFAGLLRLLSDLGAEGLPARPAAIRPGRAQARGPQRLGRRAVPVAPAARRALSTDCPSTTARSRFTTTRTCSTSTRCPIPSHPGRTSTIRLPYTKFVQPRPDRAREPDLGQHVRRELGSHSGSRQRLGRPFRRSERPEEEPDGRARRRWTRCSGCEIGCGTTMLWQAAWTCRISA